MRKKQDKFVAIDADTNPSLLDPEKGIMIDNLNGYIIRENGKDFVWKTGDGTKKILNLPPVEGVPVIQKSSISNLYYFDGRREKITDNGLDTTRLFTINIYIADELMSFKGLTGKIQIRTFCQNNKDLTITYRLSDFPTLGAPITGSQFFDMSVTGKNCERHFHEQMVVIWGLLNPSQQNGISCTVKKNGVTPSQPDFVPELEVKDPIYFDFGYYNEFVKTDPVFLGNVVIECVPFAPNIESSVESATKKGHNYLGWGDGSINPGVHFPSQGPFPTPGDDFKINPWAVPRPQGMLQIICDDDYVAPISNKIMKFDYPIPYNPASSGGPTDISFDDTLATSLTMKIEQDKLMFNHTAKNQVVKCDPPTFAYAIQKQISEYKLKRQSEYPEIISACSISQSKIFILTVLGKETVEVTQGYIATIHANGVDLDKVFETTEDLGVSLSVRPKRMICRNEGEDSQKIYWTTGFGAIRELDLIERPTSDFEFNTRKFKPVDFGKVQISKVSRNGGTLLVGGYQACYALSIDGINWTKASLHSNPVFIGQTTSSSESITEEGIVTYPTSSTDITYVYQGFQPGTKTNESIEICISNIDRRYKYIKVFAIERISGSQSAIVNVIAVDELRQKDYLVYRTTHKGITSIIESGLNISDVTSPSVILENVNDIIIEDNRMIFVGYDEYSRSLNNTELGNIEMAPAGITQQPIGFEHKSIRFGYPCLNAHKNWWHQQWHKSIDLNDDTEYAIMLLDEYGNVREPVKPFSVNPGGSPNWFQLASAYGFFPPGSGYSGQPAVHTQSHCGSAYLDFGSNDAPAPENTRLFTGMSYFFSSVGFKLEVGENIKFPSWAKKAVIVRRKKNNNQDSSIWGWAAGHGTNDYVLTLGFFADLHGYNSPSKFNIMEGDEVYVHMVAGRYGLNINKGVEEGAAPYLSNGGLMVTPQIIRTGNLLDIGDFSGRTDLKYIIKAVSAITTQGGIFYQLTLDKDIVNDIFPIGPNTTRKGVIFQVKKKRTTASSSSIIDYENTGYEFDLRYKIEPKTYRIFGGDNFLSSAIKVEESLVNLRDVYNVDFDVPTHAFNDANAYVPDATLNTKSIVLWMPVMSKNNFSLGGNHYSFLPSSIGKPDDRKLNYNNDYSSSNNLVPIKYIAESYMKEKTRFKSNIRYSEVKPLNSKFDAFSVIKANSFVDFLGYFGEAKKIAKLGKTFFVIFEQGISTMYPNNKEFMQSSSGNRVSVGDGSYLVSKDDDLSSSFGTIVNPLVTEEGIYFIDSISNAIVFLQENQKPIDLSFVAKVKSKIIGYLPKSDGTMAMNESLIAYDQYNKEIHFQLSNKTDLKLKCYVESVSPNIRIYIKPEQFNLNGKTVIVEDFFTWSMLNITEADYEYVSGHSVVEDGNYYVKTILRANNPNFFTKLNTSSLGSYNVKNVNILDFKTENLIFSEKLKAFIRRSSRTFEFGTTSNDQFISIDPFTKNSIHITEESNKMNHTEISKEGLCSPFSFQTSVYNQHWTRVITPNQSSVLEYNDASLEPESTIIRYIETNLAVGGPGCSANLPFLYTTRRFVFEKGCTYNIEFDCFCSALSDLSFTGKLFRLSVCDDSLIDIVSNTDYSIELGVTKACSIVFKPKKSFSSSLFFKNLNAMTEISGMRIKISLKKVESYNQFEAMVKVALNHNFEEKELLTHDSGIIYFEPGTPIPDEITIGTAEQGEIFNVTGIKNVLRKYEYFVPFGSVGGLRERARGFYTTTKVVFKNITGKFVITAIEHIFRKSP